MQRGKARMYQISRFAAISQIFCSLFLCVKTRPKPKGKHWISISQKGLS